MADTARGEASTVLSAKGLHVDIAVPQGTRDLAALRAKELAFLNDGDFARALDQAQGALGDGV